MGGKKKGYKKYGVGINDVDGKVDGCPFYRRWNSMLQRCYSENYHKYRPTYKDCEVCEDWLTFSNFKSWMEEQDWEGKQLDKDFLGNGKLYSPETCCFISGKVNSFLAISKEDKELPIGVSLTKDGYYVSQFSDGKGKKHYKGCFNSPLKAHRAWQINKVIIGAQLPYLCKDVKVLERLRVIINNILNDYISGNITKREVFYE